MRDEVASRVPYLSSRTDGHPPAWICNAVEPRPRPRHRSPRPEKGLAHLDPSACAGLGHAPTHTLRMCGDHHPSPAHAPHHNRHPLRRRSPPAAPLVDQTLYRPRSSRHPPQRCPHPRLSPGEFASLQVNSPYINSCGTHRSAARIRARPGAKSQAQPPSPPATAPAHCAPRCPSQPCLLRRIRVSCTIPCLAELRVDAHTIPRHKSLNSSGCDNRE